MFAFNWYTPTCTGRSPVFVTRRRTRSRPLLMTISSLRAIIAPGSFSREYRDGSCTGKKSSDGIGKKDPESAAAMSPSSDAIGSWTVTRKTLLKRSGHQRQDNHNTRCTRHGMYLLLGFHVGAQEQKARHDASLEDSFQAA